MSGVGRATIKKIKVQKDMFSEVKNYIVKKNKIMPENLYSLSFGHSIAVGITLDPIQPAHLSNKQRVMGEGDIRTTLFLLMRRPCSRAEAFIAGTAFIAGKDHHDGDLFEAFGGSGSQPCELYRCDFS